MDQANLFGDNVYDAFESLVHAMGGFKRVAHELWPQKGIDAGAKDLRNALNPDHRAKLDLFDIVALLQMGQRAGDHSVMAQLHRDTGYEPPKPVNRQSERDELQKQFVSKVGELNDIVAELKRNGVTLEAVK